VHGRPPDGDLELVASIDIPKTAQGVVKITPGVGGWPASPEKDERPDFERGAGLRAAEGEERAPCRGSAPIEPSPPRPPRS
jgi:hypothetical protein